MKYERKDGVPPYLEQSAGRVALVLRPVPRWVPVGVAALLTLIWLFSLGLTLLVAYVWRRGRVEGGGAATLLLALAVAGHAVGVYRAFAYLLGDSRLPYRIEIAGGMLSFNTARPLGRMRTLGIPLSRVDKVTAREEPFAGKTLVDLRIDLRSRAMRRLFHSPYDGFAADVERAFNDALARQRERGP